MSPEGPLPGKSPCRVWAREGSRSPGLPSGGFWPTLYETTTAPSCWRNPPDRHVEYGQNPSRSGAGEPGHGMKQERKQSPDHPTRGPQAKRGQAECPEHPERQWGRLSRYPSDCGEECPLPALYRWCLEGHRGKAMIKM